MTKSYHQSSSSLSSCQEEVSRFLSVAASRAAGRRNAESNGATTISATSPFSSLLLSGPRGCGKSTIVKKAIHSLRHQLQQHNNSSSVDVQITMSHLDDVAATLRQELRDGTTRLASHFFRPTRTFMTTTRGKQSRSSSSSVLHIVLLDHCEVVLCSSSSGGGEANDDRGNHHANNSHHSDLPSFTSDLINIVRNANHEKLYKNSNNTICSRSGGDTGDHDGPDGQVVVVFIALETYLPVGGGGDQSASNSLLSHSLKESLFDMEVTIPPPNRQERFDIARGIITKSVSKRAADNDNNSNAVVAVDGDHRDSDDETMMMRDIAEVVADKTGGWGMRDLCCITRRIANVLLLQRRTTATTTEDDRESGGAVSSSSSRWVRTLVETMLGKERTQSKRQQHYGQSSTTAASSSFATVEVEKVYWSDIAGLHSAKNNLIEMMVTPLKYSHLYTVHTGGHHHISSSSLTPSIGALLYGPPGNGKTMLAKAMATELSASFLYLDLPHLIHGEVGESERILSEFFAEAKRKSPCVMFVDEIQAAFTDRSHTQNVHEKRLVSHFMTCLDDIRNHFATTPVYFVGATNVKEMLDQELLRPGRIDTLIEVPKPDLEAATHLLKRAFGAMWKGLLGEEEDTASLSADGAASSSMIISSSDCVNNNDEKKKKKHMSNSASSFIDVLVESTLSVIVVYNDNDDDDAMIRRRTRKHNGYNPMSGAELRNVVNVFTMSVISSMVTTAAAATTASHPHQQHAVVSSPLLCDWVFDVVETERHNDDVDDGIHQEEEEDTPSRSSPSLHWALSSNAMELLFAAAGAAAT